MAVLHISYHNNYIKNSIHRENDDIDDKKNSVIFCSSIRDNLMLH